MKNFVAAAFPYPGMGWWIGVGGTGCILLEVDVSCTTKDIHFIQECDRFGGFEENKAVGSVEAPKQVVG